MTAQPVEYKGMTYYPIAHAGCDGCAHEHEHSVSDCKKFTAFVKATTGVASSCTQHKREIIWQVGGCAQIQYLTERLTR